LIAPWQKFSCATETGWFCSAQLPLSFFCEAARSLPAMRNDGQSTAQQQVATGTTAEACGQSHCCNCIAIEGICK